MIMALKKKKKVADNQDYDYYDQGYYDQNYGDYYDQSYYNPYPPVFQQPVYTSGSTDVNTRNGIRRDLQHL